jgi:nucleotide-binding universal stress UspA family protein
VVINQRIEHGQWAERPLGTVFQTVASQAARPILAVPGTTVRQLKRIVLAYDGSPKAREALFVLRHLATCWPVEAVLMTAENSRANCELLDRAWQYIQEAGIANLSTRCEQGKASETILRVMEEEKGDLLLLGGYGYQPLLKVFLGSTVDQVLREAWFPVLICR